MAWLADAVVEWQVARFRLLRTRLGLWLCSLNVVSGVLVTLTSDRRPVAAAVLAGLLGGVISVAYTLGSDLDREGLAVSLTHPTTPGALIFGRWLAAAVLGGGAGTVTGIVIAAHGVPPGALAVALTAFAAAGAAAAWTVAAVALAGNGAAAALFIYMVAFAVPSTSPVHPLGAAAATSGAWSAIARAAALLPPTPSRYEALAAGKPDPWIHAVASVVGGLLVARWRLARSVTGCRLPS